MVTDGERLYIGAAGHCASVGQRVTVDGVPGEIGTVVLSRADFATVGDWAFVRIDAEDEAYVDPTMGRFGGPSTGPRGMNVRAPLLGEPVLHYGHGASWGASEPTRGRAGSVVLNNGQLFGAKVFVFAGTVDYGDSGSPVRMATGEAAGIAVATAAPGRVPNVVLASRFTLAMLDLASVLGKPVTLVEGEPIAPVVQPPQAP